jgi:hypothetical protein
MEELSVIIHNVETDEIIERPMNKVELAEHKLFVDYANKKQAEEEAKAQAKAAAEGKLAALGLTTDDLRALGL